MLSESIRTWNGRSVLNALVRSYSVCNCGGNFTLGWNTMYKQLRYKHGIDPKIRCGKDNNHKPVVDYMTNDEVNKAISVAAAMCRDKGIDVSKVINSANMTKVN